MNKLTSYKEEGKIRHIKNFKLQSYQEFDNFICNSLIQSKMGEKKKRKKKRPRLFSSPISKAEQRNSRLRIGIFYETDQDSS